MTTLTKQQLYGYIEDSPGLTKVQLAEHLASTLFHVAGLLRDLIEDGSIVRATDGRRRQTYQVSYPGRAA